MTGILLTAIYIMTEHLLRIYFYISILLVSLNVTAFAQNDTGKVFLKGTVVNQKDKKLSGVSVSVLNKSTMEVFRDKTNSSGE